MVLQLGRVYSLNRHYTKTHKTHTDILWTKPKMTAHAV